MMQKIFNMLTIFCSGYQITFGLPKSADSSDQGEGSVCDLLLKQ